MEEEKIEANKKIQLVLLKGNFELQEEDVDWLNQFAPEILEEIRISLKDGMAWEEIKEKFNADMNISEAKQIRMSIYQQIQLDVILNRISGLESMIGIQLEDNDLLTTEIKRIYEKITILDEKMDDRQEELQMFQKSVEGIYQSDLMEEKKKSKKSIFKKKDKEGMLMHMVESGKFTPEQLEEITEAINQKLDSDLLLKLAKPNLTPAAMRQMRMFYQAKGKTAEKLVNEIAEQQIEEVSGFDDYEDENEDYGY